MKPLILRLFPLFFLVNGEFLTLNTKQGTLKGRVELSRGGRPYFAFYGIPYAAPPVKDLRFQNPVPPKSWEGVRDATKLPSPCAHQSDDGKFIGDEDCLYLNLYTPELSKKSSLPVMIFVYGGRFMYNHALPSRYGPHYFMDKDVILITFHYRIGALGFLSTGDNVLPGNYGLKDVVALLKWVKENIEAFGGDKDRITLAGGSSGAITVGLVLVSPLAKGLFDRCISQSGTPFEVIPPGETQRARKRAWKLASNLGCINDSVVTSEDLASCLKKLPARSIISENEALWTFGQTLPHFPFGPVIEDENVPGAFLVDDPEKLLSRNSDIPWIVGMNSAEGGLQATFAYHSSSTQFAQKIAEHYTSLFPSLSGLTEVVDNPTQLHKISETIREYFFGNSDIRTNSQGFSKMITAFRYLPGIKKCVDLYRGPLYVYYYDHRNEETFAKIYGCQNEDMGVIHGDELISMFNWSESITPVTKGIDLVVSEQILRMWTNFATFGDPNGNDETLWKPVRSNKIEHLVIKDGTLEMRDELLKEEYNFLEKLSSMGSDQS